MGLIKATTGSIVGRRLFSLISRQKDTLQMRIYKFPLKNMYCKMFRHKMLKYKIMYPAVLKINILRGKKIYISLEIV